MTIAVANTGNTNTFDYWRNRTNELAYAMSTYTVTTGGGTAAGNAAISGTFTANDLTIANSIFVGGASANLLLDSSSLYLTNSTSNATLNGNYLSVGNNVFVGNSTANVVVNTSTIKLSNSTSNISITIPTASQVGSGDYYFSSGGQWIQIPEYIPINFSVTLSGTSTQTVDSFSKSTYFAGEYLIHALDNNANNKSVSKLIVLHDGGGATSNAFITEYAILNSNSAMGVYSAYSNATHIILQYSPVDRKSTRLNSSH